MLDRVLNAHKQDNTGVRFAGAVLGKIKPWTAQSDFPRHGQTCLFKNVLAQLKK